MRERASVLLRRRRSSRDRKKENKRHTNILEYLNILKAENKERKIERKKSSEPYIR